MKTEMKELSEKLAKLYGVELTKVYGEGERSTRLYLAPPQPQSVKDALEKAADILSGWKDSAEFYGFTGDAENYKTIQGEIRALIEEVE